MFIRSFSQAFLVLCLFASSSSADIVYMVDGLAIRGEVREVTPDKVYLLLEDGVIGIPVARVKRIDYDLEARRGRLAADDFKGRYDIAQLAIQKGSSRIALEELTAAAGKQDVPAGAWKQLAFLMRDAGDNKGALAAVSQYLKTVPDDAEALELKQLLLKEITPPQKPDKTAPVTNEPSVAPGTVDPAPADTASVPSQPAPAAAPAAPPKQEGLEDGTWQVEGWGNSATVQITLSEGNKILAIISPAGGTQDKTAVGTARRLDLSGKKRLLFSAHVDGKSPLPVGLAFITSDYYESRLVSLKPGWNTDVSIDITGSDFKCRDTNWAFKSDIKRLNRVDKLVFLLYNYRNSANVFLDDIRAE
ncbi:MAG: hypothetical protein JW909_07595 [Planctomycetes bacterium]|nr:hypothetical protein [Planctomycetota bacterium]